MKQLLIGLAVGVAAAYFYFATQATEDVIEIETTSSDVVPATSFAAVPGQVGGQAFFGA